MTGTYFKNEQIISLFLISTFRNISNKNLILNQESSGEALKKCR